MQGKTSGGSNKTRQGIREITREYPRQFWVIVLGTFIDRLGAALLFPFFSLYITRKFGVGMTQVGFIFAIFAITGLTSSLVGGALADRLGRKGVLLFGIVASGLSSIVLGLADSMAVFIGVTILVGLLGDIGFPAHQAMVADLLPEEKRTEGFGILRVTANLSVTLGPMIGGLLAAQSYLLLFVSDAVLSLITAGICYVALQETKKPLSLGEEEPGLAETFGGYRAVLRDSAFTWFIGATMLMVLVYMQMNTTLSVFLRDTHGVSEQAFGYILSLNAAMVVLFQFPITRRLNRYGALSVMVAGTLLYALGFGLYGLVSTYALFLAAMAIITVGEMLVTPVSQAIVARLAPEAMRGRYMATYGFSWVIPTAIGPMLSGMVLDFAPDPRWLWYASGVLGLFAAGAYGLLKWRVGSARWEAVQQRVEIIRRLEEAEISAEDAARQLEQVEEGRWIRLSHTPEAAAERRKLHIRVSDRLSGARIKDLHLPLGLVNTILFTNGQLSADLDRIDSQRLRELIAQAASQQTPSKMDASDDQQVEVSVE
jgi:MFS family permease